MYAPQLGLRSHHIRSLRSVLTGHRWPVTRTVWRVWACVASCGAPSGHCGQNFGHKPVKWENFKNKDDKHRYYQGIYIGWHFKPDCFFGIYLFLAYLLNINFTLTFLHIFCWILILFAFKGFEYKSNWTFMLPCI